MGRERSPIGVRPGAPAATSVHGPVGRSGGAAPAPGPGRRRGRPARNALGARPARAPEAARRQDEDGRRPQGPPGKAA